MTTERDVKRVGVSVQSSDTPTLESGKLRQPNPQPADGNPYTQADPVNVEQKQANHDEEDTLALRLADMERTRYGMTNHINWDRK